MGKLRHLGVNKARLAERRKLFNLPAIYTAALIKDIGKIILHEYVENYLDKIQDVL